MKRQSDILIKATNPAAQNTVITDLTLYLGYSLHFVVTGSLQFTATVWAGNINDSTKMSALAGTATVINNTGYINNTSFAQYDYFYIAITSVTGAGTLELVRTAKGPE